MRSVASCFRQIWRDNLGREALKTSACSPWNEWRQRTNPVTSRSPAARSLHSHYYSQPLTRGTLIGIPFNLVHLLSQTLPLLGDLSDKRLLTLGVQDCYFTYETLIAFLRRHRIPHRPLRADDITPTTSFKWVPPSEAEYYRDFIHQRTLFQVLGFTAENVSSMDVNDYEGADILHDLNLPVGDSLATRFDLVLDCGTIEHVFSIKDALFNMCRMCKVGGIVVNSSPVDFIHHGFVNLSGGIFRDCYLANGFEEISLKYIAVPTYPVRFHGEHYLEYSLEQFSWSLQPPYNTSVYAAYRKVEERPLTVPAQRFYTKVWASQLAFSAPRGGKLRALLRSWVDSSPVMANLVRGFVGRRRGRKVKL